MSGWLTTGNPFMYSEGRRIVRINPGLASLKEVQEMRIQKTLSLVLARTLSACCEGSLLSIGQVTQGLLKREQEMCGRALPSDQIDAFRAIAARSGAR